MLQGLRKKIAARVSEVFVPRELILRAHDRVTVLRLSVRAQQVCLLGVFLIFAWTLSASGGFVLQEYTIVGKDREIEQQKFDYFSLLSEVAEYHEQFARIAGNLEDNQSYLLSALRDGVEGEDAVADIEERLRKSEFERNRVLAARVGLSAKAEGFDAELEQILERDRALRARVQSMRAVLMQVKPDAVEAAEVRQMLGQRLQAMESELSESKTARLELEAVVADLRANISTALEQRHATESARAQLQDEIEVLESQLRLAADRKDGLDRQVSALQQSLETAIHRGDGLADDRSVLQSELADVRQNMSGLRTAQHSIVQRLRDRTELGVDSIERTVAMTGLKVEDLLARVEGSGASQGGPFIAGDYSGDFNGDAELEIALSLLDLRLNRWNALQKIMRTLPLTVPLDSYSISSGYGKRKDPLNGRMAYHRGLDFRARMKAPIYSTAPGTVTYAGWSGPFGRMIEIDHGHGIRTRYAHLKKILVKSGQSVANREKIGLVGSSGRSTGPHLHYEVRYNGAPLNPMKFLTAGKHVFKD
ncbi:peptidoglycan DD-metalloendopeptidase family protein [Pelagibius sp.]|uniref:peptidoglycan DD-metalloendopeptidase family protein n=1 Tax=Pelagibius sp. TaxID=1931238 RepID=UPI003B5123FD